MTLIKNSNLSILFINIRSNAIAQKVSLGKFGQLTENTRGKTRESLKSIEDEFKIIQNYDKTYAIYLKILYEYYVNSKFYILLLRGYTPNEKADSIRR